MSSPATPAPALAREALERSGLSAQSIEKLLSKGFRAEHAAGELDIRQLEKLFSRFGYQFTKAGDRTQAAEIIDAFVDGTLPWEMFKANFPKRILASVLASMTPGGPAYRPSPLVEESHREQLRQDNAFKVQVAEVMSQGNARNAEAEDVLAAIKLYGVEACREHPPRRLVLPDAEGRPLGLQWSEKVEAFRAALTGYVRNREQSGSGGAILFWRDEEVRIEPTGGAQHTFSYEVLFDAQANGLSLEDLELLLVDRNVTEEQLIATVQGQLPVALVDGWL